jgi:hypothetical protein
MKVDYGIMDAKFEHCGKVLAIIDQLLGIEKAGNYRLSDRYPIETAEFGRIAVSFRESGIPQLAAFGYRMQNVILEMDEYDRTCRENAPERTQRRQKRLFREALRRYVTAADQLRPLIERGVI